MLYKMLDTECLYLGASIALNVVASYKLAQQLGPGGYPTVSIKYVIESVPENTAVTVLCNGAYWYQSRPVCSDSHIYCLWTK